jgi:hypothetical protein
MTGIIRPANIPGTGTVQTSNCIATPVPEKQMQYIDGHQYI